MSTGKSSEECRNPVGLLHPPEEMSDSGFKRASSFKLKKPDHVRLDVTLARRNSLPSPASPKMFLAPPETRPLERVRSFHLTRDGLKNRGDLIRRQSTISINSCEKCDGSVEASVSADNETPRVVQVVRVALVGCDEVGIHTLKSQFSTSEEIYINHQREDAESPEDIFLLLNKDEYCVQFVEETEFMEGHRTSLVDAVVAVFSVVDSSSFLYATKKIEIIRDKMKYNSPIFLVGNKCDLARNRTVSEREAQKFADKYKCKYTETSVVLNHNIDELLVGIVRKVIQRREGRKQTTSEESQTPKATSFTKRVLNKLKKIGQSKEKSNKPYD
ncbi:GTP-binding protein GEM-like [Saccostrea echinata]|uniref:GTP-binding protein GEM-like n=1 Tax=Saccostrea echinata TaxID=191078 RepID=UPI002A807817|nr:GTP-binding protein GEM-like [Saccostrea echinata]